MTSIKQLPVSKLKSGMVLNASVRTKRGQTIAKAGTVLNHQLIARLNFYHIESVAVEIDLDNEQISDAPASAQAPAPEPSPFPQPPVQPAPAPAPAPVAEPKPEKHERTYVEDNMSFTHKMEQSPEYIDFQMAYTLSMKELNNIFEVAYLISPRVLFFHMVVNCSVTVPRLSSSTWYTDSVPSTIPSTHIA